MGSLPDPLDQQSQGMSGQSRLKPNMSVQLAPPTSSQEEVSESLRMFWATFSASEPFAPRQEALILQRKFPTRMLPKLGSHRRKTTKPEPVVEEKSENKAMSKNIFILWYNIWVVCFFPLVP